MKKAQVSVFIISGLVMLMVAGALMMITGGKQKKESGYSDSSPVKKYVEECLRKVTTDGITLASGQSGYIYDVQGGSVKEPAGTDQKKVYLLHNNMKVPFLISGARTSPDYPWKNFPKDPETYLFPLGISFMQTERQIENQLESYINNRMKAECSDFSELNDYNVLASEPKSTVTILKEEIIVKLFMETAIEELSSGAKFSANEFIISKKSKLGKLYRAAGEAITMDNQDFLFDIKMGAVEFDFLVIKDSTGNDDIVIVKQGDESFTFARKNRRPALEFVKSVDVQKLSQSVGKQCTHDASSGTVNCPDFQMRREMSSNGCQEIATPSQVLLTTDIFPELVARDPDEDKITFKLETPGGNVPTSIQASSGRKVVPVSITATDGSLTDSQAVNFDFNWVMTYENC